MENTSKDFINNSKKFHSEIPISRDDIQKKQQQKR